jgi:hypothetical protein
VKEDKLPYVLGRDVCGEVVECGPSTRRCTVGDELFAMPGIDRGGYAEYVILKEDEAAPRPKSLDAIAAVRDDDMDMRTFSRRNTGDTKFVEGNTGKIADVLRMVAEVPEYLDAAEVLASYGIKKFPHACLLSGPVTYMGAPLPAEPYIGIAPEMAAHLGVLGTPRWMLLIENFASFNRQVREAADPDGIVVYTGGFPSDSTLDAILTLARATDCPILHWGDVDTGGIKIAYRIERALADIVGSKRTHRTLGLHLMSPDIAIRHGILSHRASCSSATSNRNPACGNWPPS